MRRLIQILVSTLAALALPAMGADDEAALFALLKAGGQVVLMRHSLTTAGLGDPPGMSLSDCSTQRNLTDEGRRAAKAIGEKWRAAGVRFDHVESSPFCRCKETAMLAFGRIDEVQPATTRGEREVREMRSFIGEKRRGNAVLVSHGTTLRNVLGIDAQPGDAIVITPRGDGRYEIRGKIAAGVS